MLTFIEFCKLNEGLSVDGNIASISYTPNEYDIHSLKMGKFKTKEPYKTCTNLSEYRSVYSSYSFVKGEVNTAILKAFKSKPNLFDFYFSENELDMFIKRTAYHLWISKIKSLNIDVVVSVKSKSSLASRFAFEFQKRINNVVYLPNSIIKSNIDIVWITSDTSKAQAKMLQKLIDKNKKTSSTLELTPIPVKERKFLRDFLEWDEIYKKIQDTR